MSFISFIYEWQNLIGAAIGAMIAIFGSLIIFLFQYRSRLKNEKKEQYNRLVAIIYELRRIIRTFELFVDFKSKTTVSFDAIFPHNFKNQVSQIRISDINPEIYDAIEKIYLVSEVFMYNLEKSNVVKTIKKESKGKDTEYIQESIICQRYWNAVSFLDTYLEDMYRQFNVICREVKLYAKKNKFLFPKDIEQYSTSYVVDKIKKYNLICGKRF